MLCIKVTIRKFHDVGIDHYCVDCILLCIEMFLFKIWQDWRIE